MLFWGLPENSKKKFSDNEMYEHIFINHELNCLWGKGLSVVVMCASTNSNISQAKFIIIKTIRFYYDIN